MKQETLFKTHFIINELNKKPQALSVAVVDNDNKEVIKAKRIADGIVSIKIDFKEM